MKTILFYIKNIIFNFGKFNCRNCRHSYISEKTGLRRCSIRQCCHGCDMLVSDRERCEQYERKQD